MISIVKAFAIIIITVVITGIIIPFSLADKAVDFRNTNIDICKEWYMHKENVYIFYDSDNVKGSTFFDVM